MRGRHPQAPSGKGTHVSGYTDDARGAVVGTVLVVAIIVSLSGLIGLLATGFSFGQILAVWFTMAGLGMLVLLALVARYRLGAVAGHRDRDWIRKPVGADLEDRLFSTREALAVAIGPEPRNCGLLIGASFEATRSMQSWVRELGRDAMTCHGLDIGREWLTEHDHLFDYVVVDVAGMGAAATEDFCRALRTDGLDLPVILVIRFPMQGVTPDLTGLTDVHTVPLGKVAVKLAILSLTDPDGVPDAQRTGQSGNRPGRSDFQVIYGDRQ